ncbi:kinase-like protein [Lindgomyces ingoldianus]|uniref:Kinase-like protein n=1 Tax=Lindgomyces ingoldianus TaxID=673940 RepID=A0ACB6QMV6_9PLEO|nr:kinase-like protein [Lindgomyces ingoldianus]KAF2468328.1 kinase-like protein [Lindgomyces ingoldianus]
MPSERLFNELSSLLVECPNTMGLQSFLPQSDLDRAITKETVKDALPFEVRLLKRRLPEKVVQNAKRVFAILVIIAKEIAIKDLLAEGIADTHLPLSRDDGEESNVLVSANGTKFKSFSAFKHETTKLTKDFLEKQWLVQAPVLDTAGKHTTLDQRCPLPFIEMEPIGAGHHSTVYRTALQASHQQGIDDNKHVVAVKEMKKEDEFNQELENLRVIQKIGNPHLIRHFATFKKGPVYYVVFPWAGGGSLKDFWENEDSNPRTPELVLWFLRQILGITSALKELHDDSRNIRHGDLKPENILHFGRGSKGILVTADVGVSRVHGHQKTNMRRDPTKSVATTRSYEAPEAGIKQTTARSRKYDIWSLGCIFLEFIIWLLYDEKAIENFTSTRDPLDYPFYKIHEGKSMVHPKVVMAIQEIRDDERCKKSAALTALLSHIEEKLLLAEVKSRDTAEDLYGKLGEIYKKAEHDPWMRGAAEFVSGAGGCWKYGAMQTKEVIREGQ